MNRHHQAPDAPLIPPYWQWDPDDEAKPGSSPFLPGSISPSQPGAIKATSSSMTATSPGVKDWRADGRPHLPASRLVGVLVCLLLLAALGSLSGTVLGRLAPTRLQGTSTPSIGKHEASGPSPVPRAARARGQSRPQASPRESSRAASPPPPPAPSLILAQDTFARPDQRGWGVASGGEHWGGDANRSTVFAIHQQHGQIGGGAGFFTALLGPDETDIDVQVSGTVSRFAHQQVNLGVVVRYQNEANYDKVYLDGTALVLMQRVAGHLLVLDAMPFVARANVSYTLRLRTAGSLLLARAWHSAAAEPMQWQVLGQDEALIQGTSGIRVLLAKGVEITISAFVERRTQ